MPNKPTALVTGANKGIGFEIAKQLGQKGFHVFLGARNEQRGKAAEQTLQQLNISCQYLAMDMEQEASIQQAFEEVKTHCDQLNVLINNAAILLDKGKSLLDMPRDQMASTLHINVIGPILSIRTFLPLLGEGSRVINISSGAGAITEGVGGFAPIYSISKTALNAVTLQYAHALKGKGIAINSVGPGWVRTDMGGSSADRSIEQGAETPVWLATEAPLAETGKFFRDKKEIAW